MKLLIRADASERIGTGHVMRCMALAQAWRSRGGEVMFALAESVPALDCRLRENSFTAVHLFVTRGSREDAEGTALHAQNFGAHWVAADGYAFGTEFQAGLGSAKLCLMLVDDYGQIEQHCADVVLDQNFGTEKALYPRRAGATRLLLGSEYALLREEFQRWATWRRNIPETARRVLVTFGGTDPANVTGRIVIWLKAFPDLDTKIVIGRSNPRRDELSAVVAASGGKMQLLTNPPDMSELMAWADVAIGSGGSTCWEMAFMGLPAFLVEVAENQSRVVVNLAAEGIAANLGHERNLKKDGFNEVFWQLVRDASRRKAMSEQGRTLIDGRGAARVISQWTESLYLRSVSSAHCRLVWNWANDPHVRAMSFSSEPISLSVHERWFATKLSDPACRFFLAHKDSRTAVGQVRFDIERDHATVSLMVDPSYRGQGYGSAILRLGIAEMAHEKTVKSIWAFIKPGNAASIRTFEKAGFVYSCDASVRDQRALRYERSSNSVK